jgi:hypothetical protein
VSALDTVLQRHLAGASLTEALAGVAEDNPQLAAISQVLALREQQAGTDTGDAVQAVAGLAAGEEADSRYKVLREQLDEITADVGRLHDTLETVAAALGACPVCLGADATCLLCRGCGVPGSLPPEPVAFDQIALPAVRARAFARSRHRGSRSHPAQPTHDPTERSAE